MLVLRAACTLGQSIIRARAREGLARVNCVGLLARVYWSLGTIFIKHGCEIKSHAPDNTCTTTNITETSIYMLGISHIAYKTKNFSQQ